MQTFKTISANTLFFIQFLLVFLLFFEEKTVLPAWLQSVGRMHPLLLHLPIGLLTALCALALFRRYFQEPALGDIKAFLLHLCALSAATTALLGFFLTREGGYDTGALSWHKWTGLALNWLCWGLLMANSWLSSRPIFYHGALIAGFATLVLAGHFGGELTHGKGYLLEPLRGDPAVQADASAYALVIEPVLQKKCFNCHNEQKAKGELVMTNPESLLQGGKNGPLWLAGDTLNSHILQRARLPEGDKKHMPPAGKPQLSAGELQLIQAWIQSGADMRKKLEEYPAQEPFRILAGAQIQLAAGMPKGKTYTFKAVDPEVLEKLNTPFCAVYPLALQSPALCADFYVRQHFDPKQLYQLQAVREQLVALNLGNMPLEDADLAQIATFKNLEKLWLNNTHISTQGLLALKGLNELRVLSIAGTKVDAGIAGALEGLPALRELFFWNSAIGEKDVPGLTTRFPQLKIHTGFVADTTEKLRLPVPILKNESNLLADTEKVVLKNPFPGAELLLSFDGSEPASSTSAQTYTTPFAIDGFTRVRAQTVKGNWLPSEVAEFFFFKKGYAPTSVELVYPPNEQYKGNGAATLCDNKKGTPDNFRDPAWLGCREQPFAAIAFFDKNSPPVKSVTLSCGVNVGSYIMPPTRVEVWGGPDKSRLKLLKAIVPTPYTKADLGKTQTSGLRLDIPAAQYPCLKVVALPLSKLPDWHPGKGDKGWVFVDEILFN